MGRLAGPQEGQNEGKGEGTGEGGELEEGRIKGRERERELY